MIHWMFRRIFPKDGFFVHRFSIHMFISSGYALWQVTCQFVNLTRWKVAICGEYMKSGFKVYEMTTILWFFFLGFCQVLLGFIVQILWNINSWLTTEAFDFKKDVRKCFILWSMLTTVFLSCILTDVFSRNSMQFYSLFS